MKALEIFNIRLITLSVVPILVLLVSVTSYGQGESVRKNKAAESASTKSTTRNKPAKKKDAGSINWKRNRRYGFIVKYKNSPNIGWVAAQVKKILLKYGFSAEQFSSVSAPDELYAYDRKPSNSYLGFDSSVPLDVREEVTKLIREILPNVHIEIMEKDADDYFLLWIL